MKKKILAFVLCICFILPCFYALTGCDVNVNNETSNLQTYSITIINGVEGGKVLPEIENDTKSVQVAEGDDYSVIVAPNEGYRVSGLLINGQKQNNITEGNVVYTFENVSKNYSIAGVFEKLPVEEPEGDPIDEEIETLSTYSITIINGVEGGKILPEIENDTKSVQVAEGEDYTVLISPDEGYRLSGLIINGEMHENTIGGNIIYTFENVSKNYSIAGVFEKIILEEEYILPSLKLEGVIIRNNDSSVELSTDLSNLSISQEYSQSGFGWVYAPTSRKITNSISNHAVPDGLGQIHYKFLNSDIINDIEFFEGSIILHVSYGVAGETIFNDVIYIYLDSENFTQIVTKSSQNLYSYYYVNEIASIEFVFSTEYALPI